MENTDDDSSQSADSFCCFSLTAQCSLLVDSEGLQFQNVDQKKSVDTNGQGNMSEDTSKVPIGLDI
eukprot:7437122-Ditylum_brightwellii.AAC.1